MSDQQQLEISFEPGLTDQFPRFRDVVRASVYGCGRPFKVVAADLDLSESMLSRMLSDNDDGERKRNFPVERLPELVTATGDIRPIYWLIESFLEDEETRQKRALSTIETLLPELQKALTHAQR